MSRVRETDKNAFQKIRNTNILLYNQKILTIFWEITVIIFLDRKQ